MILNLLLAVIACEACVEIFQSRVFDFVRRESETHGMWWYFVRCPFCESFWSSLIWCLLLRVNLLQDFQWLGFAATVLLVFRSSNVLHSLINCVGGAGEVLKEKLFTIMTVNEGAIDEND